MCVEDPFGHMQYLRCYVNINQTLIITETSYVRSFIQEYSRMRKQGVANPA